MFEFKKATKENSSLRLAIFGPSGSGKTYSSLSIAKSLTASNKIAVIDTECGSASKYAGIFEFDVLDLNIPSIENMISCIKSAEGYDVLIIDSLSHAWHELLEDVNKIAKAKYSNNTWAAWSEGTPKQKTLIRAITHFPGHIISCMRTKTEWLASTTNGKSGPVRVGLAPEQGKGIEYEFDMVMELSPDHFGSITKDRTGKFQDKIIENPGEEFGIQLREWIGVTKKDTPKEDIITGIKVHKCTGCGKEINNHYNKCFSCNKSDTSIVKPYTMNKTNEEVVATKLIDKNEINNINKDKTETPRERSWEASLPKRVKDKEEDKAKRVKEDIDKLLKEKTNVCFRYNEILFV